MVGQGQTLRRASRPRRSCRRRLAAIARLDPDPTTDAEYRVEHRARRFPKAPPPGRAPPESAGESALDRGSCARSVSNCVGLTGEAAGDGDISIAETWTAQMG